MRLGVVKRILKESLSGAPAWVDGMLGPLNQFLEQVTAALDRRLTFQDNFQCSVVSISLTHNTAKEINPQSGSLRVTGALMLSHEGQMLTGFKWALQSNGQVLVTVKFDGGVSTTEANCRILFILG